MKITDNYVFFYNGIFSNWYMSDFIVDGVKYNCGEQYIMAQKAILFSDYETLEKIMISKHPYDQKQLGRRIKNYEDALWSDVRYDVVKYGLTEKFKQNEVLKAYLLNYGNRLFVEASPSDKIWGIGLAEDDQLIDDSKNWRGQNLLGRILTDIRDELK